MSVSLMEALESAGYEVTTTVEDANWLLSKKSEFDELIEKAEELLEELESDEE
jgi:hypothetical protein